MQYPPLALPPLSLHMLADTLAEAVEKKDRYTGGHVKRTAHYALMIAREVEGLGESMLSAFDWPRSCTISARSKSTIRFSKSTLTRAPGVGHDARASSVGL